MRSESASRNKASSAEDIFHKLDLEKRTIVARTLNLHLRWWPKGDSDDNFVSWTSSLLFAIQYIFYRHLSFKDRSSWEDIKLYVIDTAQFPKGTFLADLDLIHAFCEYDTTPGNNLGSFESLRKMQDYYFGEYLSQGSLKIENKFVLIPAKDFSNLINYAAYSLILVIFRFLIETPSWRTRSYVFVKLFGQAPVYQNCRQRKSALVYTL